MTSLPPSTATTTSTTGSTTATIATQLLSKGRSGGVVVVVGGGLAGLSASIEALERGARVILVEKQPALGGNSAKATSGINGAGTHYQAVLGIHDSPDKFREETLASGRGLSQPELVEVLARESAGAIAWLTHHHQQKEEGEDRFHLDLGALSQLGGHSLARTHRVPPQNGRPVPVGATIIKALSSYLLQRQQQQQPGDEAAAAVASSTSGGGGSVEVRCSSKVQAIITEDHGQDKVVTGVRIKKELGEGDGKEEEEEEEVVLAADAVILASGGYGFRGTTTTITTTAPAGGASLSLLEEYAPVSTRRLPTTNGPFATGDGVRLGLAVGAEVALMDQVQVHPTAFSGPRGGGLSSPSKFLAPEALRGCGGIMVDHEGLRFVNELDYRDKVTAAMLQHCRPVDTTATEEEEEEEEEQGGKQQQPEGSGGDMLEVVEAYVVLNEEAATAFGKPALDFYASRGLVKVYEDAAATGLPHLAHTLHEYSQAAAQAPATPDKFGKRSFPVSSFSSHEKLWVAPVTPAIHYTMGGLRIDSQARVQRRVVDGGEGKTQLRPIKGLFAAGEVTGGLHGANRLGGNSLLECVVFGRIAGAAAAKGAALTTTAAELDATTSSSTTTTTSSKI